MEVFLLHVLIFYLHTYQRLPEMIIFGSNGPHDVADSAEGTLECTAIKTRIALSPAPFAALRRLLLIQENDSSEENSSQISMGKSGGFQDF